MKRCLLLFLSANRIHAQLMDGGKIAAQHEFSDLSDGRDGFNAFLQTTKCPAYLLTDLIEEDFRHEVVPHLIGKSRTALLQRKFDQFYRGTPFHQATLLQRQKTGRRDDDILFSALTNPSLITPWVDILRARQIPLAGIYSVPQISAPLIKSHPSNHLLLISWEKYSGLRQTYFSDHRLQISRLTPIYDDLTFQGAVAKELARTFQYLKSLSLLPSGQTLDVLLLGHVHDLIELQLELPRSADMRYHYVEISDLAKQLKIDYRFNDSDASQIFLHQLAAKPPLSSYAKPEHTHYYTLWRLRRALNWTSAALLIGSLLWGGADVWQSGGNVREATTLKNQAQQLTNEAQQITALFPHTHARASDMKATVSAMHTINSYSVLPGEILRPFSAVLNQYPQITLDELSWQTSATTPAATGNAADTPAQISVKGHLTDFAAGYRAALNYLEGFERELTAQGYRVTMLKKPLDVSASGSVADQREARDDVLGFALKISPPKSLQTGAPK